MCIISSECWYMCIYTSLHIYAYMYKCKYVNIQSYTYTYTDIFVYIFTYLYEHMCIYVYVCIHIYGIYIYIVYMCVYTYTFIHIYMFVSTYMYIRIYVYVHIHIYSIYIYIVYTNTSFIYTHAPQSNLPVLRHCPTRVALGGGYGVATVSRLLNIIGLFCKRVLSKRLDSAKDTYNFKAPTHRSPLIPCDPISLSFQHDPP